MRWKVARKKRNRTSSLWQRKEWISLSLLVFTNYIDVTFKQALFLFIFFPLSLSPFPSLSLSCHPSLFFLITIIIICLRLPFYFSFFRFPRLSNSSILSLINHLMITKLSPVYTSLSSVSSRHKIVWTTGNESNGLGKVSERERERESENFVLQFHTWSSFCHLERTVISLNDISREREGKKWRERKVS